MLGKLSKLVIEYNKRHPEYNNTAVLSIHSDGSFGLTFDYKQLDVRAITYFEPEASINDVYDYLENE